MNPEEQNKVLQAWQTSAPYWDKYRALITQMFAPITTGLIEEAQIGVGHNVLDIGGGSGEPSLTISCIVGPTGSVMYTDPVAGMVETAQAEAASRGLTNIEFRKCSADALPFPDSTFDVVVSRLAAMSFEQFWQLRTEMSESLHEKMAGLRPAQLLTIKQAAADAAQRYFVSGKMNFPAEALIVSGRKSAA